MQSTKANIAAQGSRVTPASPGEDLCARQEGWAPHSLGQQTSVLDRRAASDNGRDKYTQWDILKWHWACSDEIRQLPLYCAALNLTSPLRFMAGKLVCGSIQVVKRTKPGNIKVWFSIGYFLIEWLLTVLSSEWKGFFSYVPLHDNIRAIFS